MSGLCKYYFLVQRCWPVSCLSSLWSIPKVVCICQEMKVCPGQLQSLSPFTISQHFLFLSQVTLVGVIGHQWMICSPLGWLWVSSAVPWPIPPWENCEFCVCIGHEVSKGAETVEVRRAVGHTHRLTQITDSQWHQSWVYLEWLDFAGNATKAYGEAFFKLALCDKVCWDHGNHF